MTIELTREEIREVQAALPKFRRADPVAAAIVRRLVRAARPAKQPYASVSEAARVFGVTDQTIRNWVDRGWIAVGSRLSRESAGVHDASRDRSLSERRRLRNHRKGCRSSTTISSRLDWSTDGGGRPAGEAARRPGHERLCR